MSIKLSIDHWGDNIYGQLGDGSYTGRTIPATVTGLSGVTQVSVGERFSCALKNDGTVWCWGANYVGQLGDGRSPLTETPTLALEEAR